MTSYLLDTDALIDFSRGVQPATSWILSWMEGDDMVALCPVTVAEFSAGLSAEQLAHWEPLLFSLPYWGITPRAALHAGQHRHALRRAGRTITLSDALLAAVAREHNATLVTGNVGHFELPGLSVLTTRHT